MMQLRAEYIWSDAAAAAVSSIEEFGAFIATYDGQESAYFDHEFHRRLAEIDKLAAQTGNELKKLRRYCLHVTEKEFVQSELINHGRSKPYGYSGDFQMIDWTYLKHIGLSSARGQLWDRFYHRQIAPRAVCGRKDRFGQTLAEIAKHISGTIMVLSVGSGPAREIKEGAEYANLSPDRLKVICIDNDQRALDYAKEVIGPQWSNSIAFENRNALRYQPKSSYHLVWISGLFDYLEERLAVHLLKLMLSGVAPGGRLVLGNFAETHATRPWIEWCGDWFLIHRTLRDMHVLAEAAYRLCPQVQISYDLDDLNAIRYLTIRNNR